MKVTEIPDRLRAIAQLFESADLPEDKTISLALQSYRTDSREDMARWLRFFKSVGCQFEVINHGESAWLEVRGDVRATIFFKPGLLGGKVREVVEDDAAGIETLLAESALEPQPA